MSPSNHRFLLALEGNEVTREVLAAALNRCVHVVSRLDIVVANPPQEPTFLLGLLLIKLEHSGVDYRLLNSYGTLADEVQRYLKRYPRLVTVMVKELDPLRHQLGPKFEVLQEGGVAFLEFLPAER